jgi:hypothetical protein
MKLHVYSSLIFTFLFLLVPLITMQFSGEVKWDYFDFIAMGILLFVLFFCLTLIKVKTKTAVRRYTFFGIALLGALLIWIELAVGLFDTPIGGN